jgi:HEAT repeat protein
VSALLEALHDANKYVLRSAAASLIQVGAVNKAMVSALLKALDDTDEYVQKSAAAILGRVGAGSEEVVSALLKALHAGRWEVRRSAAEILGQVGASNEAAVSALLEALHDRNSEVREHAAASLGRLEIKDTQLRKALVVLNSCRYDWYSRVRWVAGASIQQLLDGRPIPGYQWKSLQKLQARLRTLKQIAILACVVVALLLVALTVTLLDPTSLIARWVTSLSILASIVSLIGVTLRDLWKQKQSNRVQVSNGD